MELIASARMRKAEQRAVDARPYAQHIRELMTLTLSRAAITSEHPFFVRPDDGPALAIHFTTDKGLCGGLNTRLNHALWQFIESVHGPVRVVTVGKKGREFAVRARLGLTAEFSELGDAPGIAKLRPLCHLMTEMFLAREVDRVHLCYPQFVSMLTHTPVVERVLPVELHDSRHMDTREIVFEPEPHTILDHLLVRYVEANVYRAYMELVACEYSARMVAMHSATESATELAEAMTEELNRSRQAAVTEEICDVSAGTEVLTQGARHV